MTTRTRGRPSLYREEYAEQARKLCLLGATDKELADFWGVSVQTYYDWQKAHPEFLESIMRGKILADAEVADKLYQRALGYVVNATKLYRQDDGSVLRVPYERCTTRPTPRRPACGSATGSPIAGAIGTRSTWPTPARACWMA